VHTLQANGGGIKDPERLMGAVRAGFTTPILFDLARPLATLSDQRLLLEAGLDQASTRILAPGPFSSEGTAQAFRTAELAPRLAGHTDEDLASELVYAVFRPVHMDYRQFSSIFRSIKDHAGDLEALGLRGGGPCWDGAHGCFRFPILDIHPAKTRASFFSKASAGICSATDQALFRRPDHFHLDLVDPAARRVVGNVQLYVITTSTGRALLLRGINPSTAFITPGTAGDILSAVLDSAFQLAASSGLDQIWLSEPLGVWNIDSGRPEIRALLQKLRGELPIHRFSHPFPVFTYAGREISINRAFILWKRSGIGSDS